MNVGNIKHFQDVVCENIKKENWTQVSKLVSPRKTNGTVKSRSERIAATKLLKAATGQEEAM